MEWACRILLTFLFFRVLTGYITNWQTEYQLNSPLIPDETLRQIARPYMLASLITAAGFIISLWLYFFQKKLATVILASLSLILYEGLVIWLAQ